SSIPPLLISSATFFEHLHTPYPILPEPQSKYCRLVLVPIGWKLGADSPKVIMPSTTAGAAPPPDCSLGPSLSPPNQKLCLLLMKIVPLLSAS
ncbi:hypothetical protein BaRGS_00014478, partial [Batillaria attramentaria]